jgi:hypothetical protein
MTRSMRRGAAVAALVVAGISIAAGPATASPARDRAATRSLIKVMTNYYVTGTSLMPQASRAGTTFLNQIASGCAGALDPSRLSTSQLPVANTLNLEAGFDEYIEEFDVPFRAAGITAAAAVQRLRWSNPAITRMIQKVSANLAYAATEKPTDACADINAAKSQGFNQVPAATERLLALVRGIPKPPSWRTMLNKLQPFIAGSELSAVKRFVGIYDRWFNTGAKISARNSVLLDQVLGAG